MSRIPSKKLGRPVGSKTEDVPVVDKVITACPACKSTERSDYCNRRELAHLGKTPDGRQYTHVVWQDTRCEKCGQRRVDKSFENRTE
jgi:hypothetical protein